MCILRRGRTFDGETEKFVDVIAKELVVDSEDLISKMAEAIVSRENVKA